MTGWSHAEIWFVIIGLGIATYVIRFSFLGLIGDRQLPPWLLRHLRYTPVAILPALVTPAVLWPDATGGTLSAPHLIAAGITLAIGYWRKNPAVAAVAGMAVFLLLQGVFA
ncbi:AzlD domain-containing protein [Gymnodinialimonas sp. 2305UL16-5]|uniref:AzlD domain-containing protein n=1 Tax=Gymnodinialimonas mytili TaxID=3126503 RepID=UPI0030B083DF